MERGRGYKGKGKGMMRVRRTRQLKWDEVQDTVCPSRRNFAHVPLSRSLQPGKGRMAGKSRTVEVRFYKESRVLGCDGIGESRCLLNICISRCRWKNIHRCIWGGAEERWFHLHYALSFLLPPFLLQRAALLLSLFLFIFVLLSLSCSSFRLVLCARGACNSFPLLHNNWMK